MAEYLFDRNNGWRRDLPSYIEPGTRVLCLYRVSTDKQLYHNDKNEADIPMQRIRCRNFSEQQGWTIVCELQEEGGNRQIGKERFLPLRRNSGKQRNRQINHKQRNEKPKNIGV